jgi:hypothetical protein
VKHDMTHKERVARKKARRTILDTANKHRSKDLKRYGRRHIGEAAHFVRRNRLVKGSVLEAAGFRDH